MFADRCPHCQAIVDYEPGKHAYRCKQCGYEFLENELSGEQAKKEKLEADYIQLLQEHQEVKGKKEWLQEQLNKTHLSFQTFTDHLGNSDKLFVDFQDTNARQHDKMLNVLTSIQESTQAMTEELRHFSRRFSSNTQDVLSRKALSKDTYNGEVGASDDKPTVVYVYDEQKKRQAELTEKNKVYTGKEKTEPEIIEINDSDKNSSDRTHTIIKRRNLWFWGESMFYDIGLLPGGKALVWNTCLREPKNKIVEIDEWEKVYEVVCNDLGSFGLTESDEILYYGSDKSLHWKISRWKSISCIAVGEEHVVGRTWKGTVEAVGDNQYGQCNTYGLTGWKNIIQIAAGEKHTVGRKMDGTVIAVGNNEQGQCNVDQWKDIIDISAGGETTYGVSSDGTVIAAGRNDSGQCNVEDWCNIYRIYALYDYVIGLKKNRTLIVAGRNHSNRCDVLQWENIIEVKLMGNYTLGLQEDGTILSTDNTILEKMRKMGII